MAISTVVEYTNEGLKVAKPLDGERHLVYIRPGDQIQLDFADEVQYRIIDGDVVAILPNGAQLVFLSLGSMSMTPDDGSLPQLMQQDGAPIDILTVAEISELVDQPTPVTNRFLDFQPASEEVTEIQERLSKQEERLQNTLETIQEYVADLEATAVAGTQQAANAEGEERSGTENTVELVKQTVERVIRAPEESTIPDPVNPETRNQTRVDQQKEVDQNNNPTPTITPVTQTTLKAMDILHLRGGRTDNADGTITYQGGTGSNRAALNDNPAWRAEAETIDFSGETSNVTVYADSQSFASNATMSQVIRLNHEKPADYAITAITIDGLPPGAALYYNTQPPTAIPGNNIDPTATDADGNLLVGNPPEIVIVYQADSSNFTLNVGITTQYNGDPANAPDESLITQTDSAAFPIEVTSVDGDPDNIKTISENDDGTFTAGTFANAPTDNNISTGSGKDTVYGGRGVDNINTGSGNDTIYASRGEDNLNGGLGVDTLEAYIGNNSSVNITLSEGGGQGTATYTVSDSEITQTIANIENVNTAGGNDTITGNAANNVINAAGGDDVVSGGFGNDTMDGGEHTTDGDTLSYAYSEVSNQGFDIDISNTGTTEEINGNKYFVVTGDSGERDLVRDFENIVGSGGNDTIRANNDAENTLDGGAGDDTLYGDGTDTFIGGANNEVTLTVNLDNQGNASYSLVGGDTVDFSGADSALDLTSNNMQGIENLVGTTGMDTLQMNNENNIVIATTGADQVTGGGNSAITREDTTDAEGNTTVAITGGDVYDLSRLTTEDVDTRTATDIDNGEEHSNQGVAIDIGGSNNNVSFGQGNNQQTVTGFEHVIGSDFNDTITTNNQINFIHGGDGDDIIKSSNADNQDILDGGTGNDTVDFSDSQTGVIISADTTADGDENGRYTADKTVIVNVETFIGSQRNDEFKGGSRAETFIGGGGSDTIDASLGNDVYHGDGYDSTNNRSGINISGTADKIDYFGISEAIARDAFVDTSGDDNEEVRAMLDTYNTLNPDDTLNPDGIYANLEQGQVQAVVTNPAGFRELLTHEISNIEHITGTTARDVIVGNDDNNILDGGTDNDLLMGGAGNDELKGGEGNDVLQGGAGDDVLDGGTGQDWADYSDQTGAVTITLNSGTNDVAGDTDGSATGAAGRDTLKGIEHARGGDGDDIITAGDGVANTLIGGAGDDTFKNLGAGDVVHGGEDGSDTAEFGGEDKIEVALSNITPANGAVSVKVGESNDTVTLSGIENITGGGGDDTITGDANTNIIRGGAGNDVLAGGGGGDDKLYGDAGDDIITFDASAKIISGGEDSNEPMGDTLVLTIGGTTINLSNASDQSGTDDTPTVTGFENVQGGTGRDTITGNSENNTLQGGASDDIINATIGHDIYDGGDDDDDTLDYGSSYADIDGSVGVKIDFTKSTANGVLVNAVDSNGDVVASDTTTSHISGFETLNTGSGNDTITMGAFATGGDDGGNNLSTINLGDGDDTVTVSDTTSATVAINADGDGLGANIDTHEAAGDTLNLTSSDSVSLAFSGTHEFTVGNYTVSNFEKVSAGNANGKTDTVITTGVNATSDLNGNTLTIGGANKGTVLTGFEELQTGDTNDAFRSLGASDFTSIDAGGGDDTITLTSTDGRDTTTMTINAGGSATQAGSNEGGDKLNIEGTSAIRIDTNNAEHLAIDIGGTSTDAISFDVDYSITGVETITGSDNVDNWNFSGWTGSGGVEIDAGGGADVITTAGRGDIYIGGALDGDTFNITAGSNGKSDTITYGSSIAIHVNTNGNAVITGSANDDPTATTKKDTINNIANGTIQANGENDTVVYGNGTTTIGESGAAQDHMFSGIETIDLRGASDGLNGDDNLTINVADLYNWGSQNTAEGGNEITLQVDLDDFDGANGLALELDGFNVDGARYMANDSSNPDADGDNVITIGAGGEITDARTYTLYYTDTNTNPNPSEDLQITIQVS